MAKKIAKHIADCPGCENNIPFDREPRIGAEIECRSCGATLEVIFLRPIELDWAGAGYDDDDDEWEDDRWGDY